MTGDGLQAKFPLTIQQEVTTCSRGRLPPHQASLTLPLPQLPTSVTIVNAKLHLQLPPLLYGPRVQVPPPSSLGE